MNILSLDTSTEALGLCLQADNQLRISIIKAGLKHSETLLPKLNQIILEAGITPRNLQLIVCSIGPGSFTGVRIGLATAKGIAEGCGCPLIGISNLDALAYRFRYFDGLVAPVLSAMRKRYYSALYQKGVRVSDYLDISLDALVERLSAPGRILLTGSQGDALFKRLQSAGSCTITLDAGYPLTDPQALLEIGQKLYNENRLPVEEIKPLYLRKSEAEINLYGE